MPQERANVVVPQLGVRRDVNSLMATPDMMVEGTNVIVFDGALRPRPGLSRQEFGIQANAWIDIKEGYNCSAILQDTIVIYDADDGDGHLWQITDDDGDTWRDITSKVTGISVAPTRMFGFEVFTSTYIMAWGADGYIYRADATALPMTPDLAFTQIGRWTLNPTQIKMTPSDPVFISAYGPHLFWQPYADGAVSRAIHILDDPHSATSGTWATKYRNTGRNTFDPRIYKLDGAGNGYFYKWCKDREQIGQYLYHLTQTVSADLGTEIPFAYSAHTLNAAHKMQIVNLDPLQLIGIAGGGLQQIERTGWMSHTTTPISLPKAGYFTTWAESDSHEVCILGLMNERTDDYTTGWNDWESHEDFPSDWRNLVELYAYLDGSKKYIAEEKRDGVYHLWWVKGNSNAGFGVAGDPAIGNTLTLFQASLDTEPYALFMGTTKALLKLNRTTDEWENVSPPGEGETTYPIDGTENSNRWVFRTAEKGGDKYVLATNGQQVPLVYPSPPGTPGDPDVFRPMGDVDDDGVIGEGETAAPIAHCMALANNRLILGNLSADTPCSIRISDAQDFDTGYSVEYKLNDTPGAIVAMRELSAITIAIIKEDAIYHGISQVEFMGTSAPMRFELIRAGIMGPCSDASVVYLPDGRLCWLGRDGGVYIYDGANVVDAGRHIRHLIFPLIDEERFGWAHACVDPKRNLLYVFFPTMTEPYGMNMGATMSFDQGSTWPVWLFKFGADWEMMSMISVFFWRDLTYRDLWDQTYGDPNSQAARYGDYQGGEYEMVIANRNNSVYTQVWDEELFYSDNGAPIVCTMRTGWYDFDDLYALDTFHTLDHNVRMPVDITELQWKLISEQPDGTTLESTSTMPVTGRVRTSYRQTGRRHAFELYASTEHLWYWAGATGTFSRRGGR